MPQILKNEVRERILQSALDCFLSSGYRDASMQEIAQKAGIAAGNIYNYFKSKELIFSTLVGPVVEGVKAIFSIRAGDLPLRFSRDGMGIAEKKMGEFVRLYQANRKVFLLLFEKSGSTEFEYTRADVINSLSSAVIRAKNSFALTPATPEQELLVRAYAAAYISGIINILTEKTSEDLKLKALKAFLPFMRGTLVDNLRD